MLAFFYQAGGLLRPIRCGVQVIFKESLRLSFIPVGLDPSNLVNCLSQGKQNNPGGDWHEAVSAC